MEQKQGNIAYCIPTYNHPDTIRDVLEKSAALYKEYDIDIYIYDSSEERDTEDIVNEFIQCGYDNIFYIKTNHNLTEKIVDIFKKVGWTKNYKYFWPVKDRNYFGENTLKEIVKYINDDNNVIFIPIMNKHPMEKNDSKNILYYKDAAEFYGKWGWLCSSLDVVIFQTKSMLEDIKIEEIYQKYPKVVMEEFDLYVFLFDILSLKQNRCRIRVITKIEVYESAYSKSSWYYRKLEVVQKWAMANDILPSCYDRYKIKNIKCFCSLPWIIGSIDELINLKEFKVLNIDSYHNLENQWEKLVDIPINWVYLIINERYFELKQIVLKQIEVLIEKEKYEQAYWIYKTNTWIGRYDNDIEYKVLNKFFVIYQKEKDRENRNDVFYAVKSYEDMKNKYFSLKHLLWRLEYEIGDNEEFYLLEYMRKYKVSNIFLAYLISESCVNKDKVVNLLMKNKE